MKRSVYAVIAIAIVVCSATVWAGNVYMLEGAGGNIGVSVGSDGILLVDNQFEPLAEKIKATLEKLGKGELKFVLNTHHHGDYTGGNMVFGTEAPIIAHTNIRKRLQAKQPPKGTLPVVTLKTSLSIHFNNEEIRVMHFPNSYTDGNSVIFFTGSNVVRMGDLLFSGRFRCRRRCRRTDKEYRVDLSQISVRREDYSGTRPPFWYQ